MSAARLTRSLPEPETRVGNCCGCHTCPVALFKIPGIYRYRCDGCFEQETGRRHHLSPARKPAGCTCDAPAEALKPNGAEVLVSSCSVHGEKARPDLWRRS